MKTKKLILAAVALVMLTTNIANAQKNIVRISPLGFLKFKTKLHYERVITDKVSAGLIANYMFGLFNGYRVDPYARFYFQGAAPSGWYLQGKYHLSLMTVNSGTVINGYTPPANYGFTEMGGSLGAGYQVLFGKSKNFVFDVYSCFRFSSLGYT